MGALNNFAYDYLTRTVPKKMKLLVRLSSWILTKKSLSNESWVVGQVSRNVVSNLITQLLEEYAVSVVAFDVVFSRLINRRVWSN